MTFHAKGTVHGRRIELSQDPGLPDGTSVEVIISGGELSVEARGELLESLAGAWKEDTTIGQIFDEIIAGRLLSPPRPIDFDAAS